jgi:hypothetical protein
MIVSLAVVLAGCSEPQGVRIILEGSDNSSGHEDWERFVKVVESTAGSARLTPRAGKDNSICRGWSTAVGPDGVVPVDGLVLNACPERDFRGTHLPAGATALWNSVWWNPIAVSRAKAMSSTLIAALRAEFGDRIKVTQ